MEGIAFSVPTLRQLSAMEVLQIRRQVMAMNSDDALERSLLGNAMILAACCVEGEAPVFADGQAVLNRLTVAQMERILQEYLRQSSGETSTESHAAVNAGFDEERFRTLREGG